MQFLSQYGFIFRPTHKANYLLFLFQNQSGQSSDKKSPHGIICAINHLRPNQLTRGFKNCFAICMYFGNFTTSKFNETFVCALRGFEETWST